MKTQSTLVYRDEGHETTAISELKAARTALQAALDIWISLDVSICNDIFALITNPEKNYSDAINENIEIPQQPGRYQLVKDVYLNSLQIPIPDSLYRICRDCRKLPFTNIPQLWSIENNQVVMNQNEAEKLIDSQSIYASGEKIQLAKNILKYVELTNELNEQLELLIGSPAENMFFLRKPFQVIQKSFPGPFILELVPDKLKELLQG